MRERKLKVSVEMKVYLPPSKLAAYLHLTEKTLANWRAAGRGPPFRKYGRMVLYRSEDINIWMEVREWKRKKRMDR